MTSPSDPRFGDPYSFEPSVPTVASTQALDQTTSFGASQFRSVRLSKTLEDKIAREVQAIKDKADAICRSMPLHSQICRQMALTFNEPVPIEALAQCILSQDQVEFQAKGRRGLAPPTLHGPGNLRPNVMDTMMAVLCMFTDDVLKAMCRGDIKDLYDSLDWRVKNPNDKALTATSAKIPRLYVNALTSARHQHPTVRDLKRIVDILAIYLDDLDHTTTPPRRRLTPTGQRKLIVEAIDRVNSQGLPYAIDTPRHVPKSQNVASSANFLAKLRDMVAHLGSLNDDDRIPYTLVDVGYSNVYALRCAEHARYSKSIPLMNLVDAICVTQKLHVKIHCIGLAIIPMPHMVSIAEHAASMLLRSYAWHECGLNVVPGGRSVNSSWNASNRDQHTIYKIVQDVTPFVRQCDNMSRLYDEGFEIIANARKNLQYHKDIVALKKEIPDYRIATKASDIRLARSECELSEALTQWERPHKADRRTEDEMKSLNVASEALKNWEHLQNAAGPK